MVMSYLFKYQLEETGKQEISIPAFSEILTVHEQNGKICIWAKVDPKFSDIKRIIRMFCTGDEIPSKGLEYIGTCQIHNGAIVLHFFEEIK